MVNFTESLFARLLYQIWISLIYCFSENSFLNNLTLSANRVFLFAYMCHVQLIRFEYDIKTD